MIHTLEAHSLAPGGASLRFTWNEATGEVTGPDAAAVVAAAGAAQAARMVEVQGRGYTISNPLRCRDEMALLMVSMGYNPPDFLRGALPLRVVRL